MLLWHCIDMDKIMYCKKIELEDRVFLKEEAKKIATEIDRLVVINNREHVNITFVLSINKNKGRATQDDVIEDIMWDGVYHYFLSVKQKQSDSIKTSLPITNSISSAIYRMYDSENIMLGISEFLRTTSATIAKIEYNSIPIITHDSEFELKKEYVYDTIVSDKDRFSIFWALVVDAVFDNVKNFYIKHKVENKIKYFTLNLEIVNEDEKNV